MFKHSSSARSRSGAKVGTAISTSTLDRAVDQAEETYLAFRVKLKSLIATLKAHHEAMLRLNSSQLQVTNAICESLINSPISKVVVGTDHDTQEFKSYEPNGQDKSVMSGNERESEDSIAHHAGGAHSFRSVIGHGQNLEDLEESFRGLFSASNDLNLVYAQRYQDWIVGYLEEWETIVSTRIEGRLIEYRKLRRSHAHYTEKVQGLHEKVDKQKAKRASGASPRLEGKLDRNRLKLSGAEEAHNDFGRSLLSLIEEVCEQYWKDLVPLLHMMIEYNINHSSDVATIMARLDNTDAILQSIAEQHDTRLNGRLDDLRPEPVPEDVKIQPETEPDKLKEEEEEKEEEGVSVSESKSLESV